ncbi:hypothetical protein LMG23992_04518 [Cupriavidus laharis]|uniref:CcoQ/FixQ family Cbb3-type cytochrome c oxidase assembly chaperone n=1 Tax=Cupriavidus laharis TaxID=151654 RepID=A0ABN7Z678_9BURK|nr:hypothetical protein [Cupriavidus laharis]CAG9181487.1 hypothetical protein LMG23992_04518 [Cupriavidus laharis]
MEYVTSLGAYMVALLVALLVAARWLLKHDPALRIEPAPDVDHTAPPGAGD